MEMMKIIMNIIIVIDITTIKMTIEIINIMNIMVMDIVVTKDSNILIMKIINLTVMKIINNMIILHKQAYNRLFNKKKIINNN